MPPSKQNHRAEGQRNPRRTRWLHAATYVLTFILIATGWWLLLGREGEPSALARAVGRPDIDVHKTAGWALVALGVAAAVLGRRGLRTFTIETLRFRRGDAHWFARWPAAVFTGRFPRHEGHFDPGQRAANVVMVGGLLLLVVTGLGLVMVPGGSVFVWIRRVHRWATYVVTIVIAGHIVVASGILPGYRGVARAMHLGGRVRADVARRLWPAWAEENITAENAKGHPAVLPTERNGPNRRFAAALKSRRTLSKREKR